MKIFTRYSNAALFSMLFMVTVFVTGCGSSSDGSASKGPVNLGTAGNFAILSKAGITNTPTSAITGDSGSSPITAAAIDVTCGEINGSIYGSDAAYTGSGDTSCFKGTSADNTLVANAVLDMQTAYTDAAGRTLPDYTELYAGDVSGRTLTHGVYKWSSGLLITAAGVTISGSATDVWIFQIAKDLTVLDGAKVTLEGGALAKNIFWQVGGTGVTLGTTVDFKGVILTQKAITLNTGATVNGRLLAQSAVTLDSNIVTAP
ncbi:MAG: ice-binding family protein [Thiovulaceae bacterium]|nr:ice-binding family protein [Sulfurimonadaceae bacterium]